MFRGILVVLLISFLAYRVWTPPRISPDSNETTLISSFFSLRRPTTALLSKFQGNNSSLFSFLLLLSGDVENNPGPRSIYPCGICEQDVTWEGPGGICCDTCDIWFHNECCGITSHEYLLLGRSNVQWKCPRCDSINVDSFTFNGFELSCYNSFSPLNLTTIHSTIDSLTSEPFSPIHTSSPQQQAHSHHSTGRNTMRHQHSHSRHPTKNNKTTQSDSDVFDLPKKTNLRIMNINCQSVMNKKAELHSILHYVKPDIVFLTESWLYGHKPGKPPSKGAHSNSEFCPQNYQAFRNDRTTVGGGVLIMAHNSLTVEEKPELVTNCEMNWVCVKLQNHRDLYAGVYYMPHRNPHDCQELEKSLNKVTVNGTKDRDIILAGDFNCPGIDWKHNTVSPGSDDRPIQEAIVDITSTALLSQIHDQPTRYSNTIDLVFTSNPSLLKSTSSIPGISDHNVVVSDFDTRPCIKKEKPKKFYKFREANWENVQNDMEKVSEEIKELYLIGENTDTLWKHFKTSLMNSIEKHIPTGFTKSLSHSKIAETQKALFST